MNDSYQSFIVQVLLSPLREVSPALLHPHPPEEDSLLMEYPKPYAVYPQFIRTKKELWYLRYKTVVGIYWTRLHLIRGMQMSWSEFLDTLHLFGFRTEWAGSGAVVDPEHMPSNQMACIEYGKWTIATFAAAEPFDTPLKAG